MLKNTNQNKYTKKTGRDWNNSLFNLEFLDYRGWLSDKQFDSEAISRDEFLLRSSNCKIKPPENLSRQSAKKFRGMLGADK